MNKGDLQLTIIMADTYLLVGAIPSTLLAVLGIFGAAVQLRYKNSYISCLSDDLEDDRPLYQVLRGIQCLFYLYSLTYFAFIYRPKDVWYSRFAIIFSILNIAIIGFAVFGFYIKSKDLCASTMIGTTVTTLCGLGALSAACVLIISSYFVCYFKVN